VKCTDRTQRRKKRIWQLRIRIASFFIGIIAIVGLVFFLLNNGGEVRKLEKSTYNKNIYQSTLFADEICVTNEEVEFKEFYRHDKFHGALLFDVEDNEVLYSESAHEQLYPASTTKIMTAYLAMKYGDMNDTVTISKHAVNIPSDSSTAHLKEGDRITLLNLLYGLMLPSGNDSALAIAEHISGSEEAFVELMNEEAALLGATNSHFVNPHGYQDKEHYTTAYDLYLIFKECLKEELFIDIISSTSKTATITEKSGVQRTVTWGQTNQFVTGARKTPKGITIIGGKTGNTFDAGSCLVMYGKNSSDTPYISIIMGASSKRNLYDNMTYLWNAVPTTK
jgi:D-alanyl-D-alanine carboxypeptidase (penicillin-binding protein 5/6)